MTPHSSSAWVENGPRKHYVAVVTAAKEVPSQRHGAIPERFLPDAAEGEAEEEEERVGAGMAKHMVRKSIWS